MNSLVNLLTFVILTSFRNTQSTSSSASSRFSVKRYDPIRAIYATIHAKVRSMNLDHVTSRWESSGFAVHCINECTQRQVIQNWIVNDSKFRTYPVSIFQIRKQIESNPLFDWIRFEFKLIRISLLIHYAKKLITLKLANFVDFKKLVSWLPKEIAGHCFLARFKG